MPYRDPEKQRAYQREYQRRRRAAVVAASQTLNPPEVRVRTAHDVLDLLEEAINSVRSSVEGDTLMRARCVGYLASIALKAVEVADLAARVEALEQILKERKIA